MFDVLPKDPLKSAKTEKEIKELLEAGFEYVFNQGHSLFQKEKVNLQISHTLVTPKIIRLFP